VLQFAFDGRADNPHLPANYTPDSIVYTGSREGARSRQWYDKLPAHSRQALWECLKRPAGEAAEVAWELINLAWSSRAAVAIVPLQDMLAPGDSRTTKRGRARGHYRRRCTEEMLSASALHRLRELTKATNRSSGSKAALTASALQGSRTPPTIEAAL
jgi:4-alpha-glucanotransferase